MRRCVQGPGGGGGERGGEGRGGHGGRCGRAGKAAGPGCSGGALYIKPHASQFFTHHHNLVSATARALMP